MAYITEVISEEHSDHPVPPKTPAPKSANAATSQKEHIKVLPANHPAPPKTPAPKTAPKPSTSETETLANTGNQPMQSPTRSSTASTNPAMASSSGANTLVLTGSHISAGINNVEKLRAPSDINKHIVTHIASGAASNSKAEVAVDNAWELLKEYHTVILIDDSDAMDYQALIHAERAAQYVVHYAQKYGGKVSLRFFNFKENQDIEIKPEDDGKQIVRDAFAELHQARPTNTLYLLGRAMETALTTYMDEIHNAQIAREDAFSQYIRHGLDYEPVSKGKKTVRDKVIALGLKEFVMSNKSDVRKPRNDKERLALKDGVALLGSDMTPSDKGKKALKDLSEKYESLKIVAQPIQKKSFVVITAGKDPNGQNRARQFIRQTSDDLIKWHFPSNQVGVQLVQIGHDPEATAFLKSLDEGIENKKRLFGGRVVSDLVDTISYDLDENSVDKTPERVALFVYYALLGAINPAVDQRASLVKSGRLAGLLNR